MKSGFKLSCVCLLLEKLVNEISFILDGKHFLKIAKNSKIYCYLLMISNMAFNLIIVIYFVLNLFFSISSLKI